LRSETEARLQALVEHALGHGTKLISYKPADSVKQEWVDYVVRWHQQGVQYGTHIASLSLHLVPEDADALYWGHYFPYQRGGMVLAGATARADYEKRT
jgi:hypothetical protein